MKCSMNLKIVMLVFIALCSVGIPVAQAQLRGASDSSLASASGYLWSRSWQYTNLSKFKGDVRDSIADAPLIRQVLFEAQQAQVSQMPFNLTHLQALSDTSYQQMNQLLLTHFASSYHRCMDTSFFQTQYWDSTSHSFHYPSTCSQTFSSDTLVLFGALQETVVQPNFLLRLDSNLLLGEWAGQFQYSFAIDDTSTYSILPVGVSLPVILDTSFTRHFIYLKATRLNRVYSSAFSIDLLRSSVVFPSPDLIIPISANLPFQGGYASAEIGVWKSCLQTNGFNQPVIIVEGFDPQNSRGLLSSNRADANLYCISNASVANHTNMLDSLRAYGHDVLIVNFMDGGTYVERNAMALIAAINYINALKEGNDELVIVGASMGGLVSRYALLYMERHAQAHHCRLWVSFDSPHKGANVPIGLQMMIDFIYDNLSQMPYAIQQQVPPLRDAVLNCPAAREMLLSHYSACQNGNVAPCAEFHQLYDTLDKWGFPNCRRLAFSDGNHAGGDQGFNAGQQLMALHFPVGPLSIQMKANAVSQGSSAAQVFDASIQGIVGGIPYTIAGAQYTITNGNGIDNASGGSNTFHMDVAKSLGIQHGQTTFGTCLMQEDNFVPVSSALAIQTPINYQTPISALMPNLSYLGRTHAASQSPFDALYCMTNYYSANRNATLNNAPHVLGGFDLDMMQLICSEVMPRVYYLQHTNWTALHEVEALQVLAGKNVNSNFLNADFTVASTAVASIRAVDKIELKDGVRMANPVYCRLTSQAALYSPNCIQLASTQAYRAVEREPYVVSKNSAFMARPNEMPKGSLNCVPNLVSSTCQFYFDDSQSHNVELFDGLGHLALSKANCHNGEQVDLSALTDGLYLLRIAGEAKTTIKIIKQSL